MRFFSMMILKDLFKSVREGTLPFQTNLTKIRIKNIEPSPSLSGKRKGQEIMLAVKAQKTKDNLQKI